VYYISLQAQNYSFSFSPAPFQRIFYVRKEYLDVFSADKLPIDKADQKESDGSFLALLLASGISCIEKNEYLCTVF